MAYCGIDVGTQGVRAAVLDADGRVLATGSAPLSTDRRTGERHEQDAGDWWAALTRAVRHAVDARPAREVTAVALDATSGTLVVEDAAGDPVGPALMYDDARAGEQAARAARTGAPLWRALGYAMQPSWALPKAMWLAGAGAVPPRRAHRPPGRPPGPAADRHRRRHRRRPP